MPEFLSFDGIKIAYETWGAAGERPPVLLHHGFIANAEINWVRPGIVTALTQAGCQVFALDARGHGASGKPHDPAFYGEAKMVRDLQQLIDLIGVDQVDLVGYSMGAIVSLSTASQDARIRRLVVGGVGAGVVEAGGLDTLARLPATRLSRLYRPRIRTLSRSQLRGRSDRSPIGSEATAMRWRRLRRPVRSARYRCSRLPLRRWL